MDFRQRAIYALAALCLCGGCRQNAARHELLERELRTQEDRIYELEAELDDAKRALQRSGAATPGRSSITTDACPPTTGTILRGPTVEFPAFSSPPTVIEAAPPTTMPSGPDGAAAPTFVRPLPAAPPAGSTSAPALPSEFDISPPKVVLPETPATVAPATVAPTPNGGVPTAPPSTRAPVLSPPDPNKPEGLPSRGAASAAPSIVPIAPPTSTSSAPRGGEVARGAAPLKSMSSPKFRSPGARRLIEPHVAAASPSSPAPEAAFVSTPTQIRGSTSAATSLHMKLADRSGGWNSDGRPGDEGLRLVVEVRDVRRQLVSNVGVLTIVVIDPAIADEGGRYARWDFAAEDAAAAFRPAEADGDDEGFVFELPWPDAPPAHAGLHVFVRVVNSDGGRLEADRRLTVDVGGAGTATSGLPNEPGIMPAGLADPISNSTSSPTDARPATLDGGTALSLPKELAIPIYEAPPRESEVLIGPALGAPTTQAVAPRSARR